MTSSRLYLPKLQDPPATILEYLFFRFPKMQQGVWRARVSRGVVTLSDGRTLKEDSPYQHGLFVFYKREVSQEPATPEDPLIIHRDRNIIVVNKPHGMPVTPTGQWVQRSLLCCLERLTGLDTLAPMHRLDRETSGLLLLATNSDVRAQYHLLFQEGLIEREYRAIASVNVEPRQTQWRVENRLAQGDPWFRRKIIEGPPNAITDIELLELRGSTGCFRLLPQTGKKHQLRIHMTSIGFPIVGDPFYPEIREKNADEPPLQLFANRLSFTDPLSGQRRHFEI